MLQEEQYLTFKKLIKVVPTTGSGPLHCILSDGGSYFCKKSNFLTGCKYDLVNEVVAANVLKRWGLFVPQYRFAKIDFLQIEGFLTKEYKGINKPESYIQIKNPFTKEVFETPFFASKEFLLHLHLEKRTSLENLRDFQVENLDDFFLIILFDLWFHNVDRKGTNSNTLIVSDESGTARIAPIDHVQCFGVNRKFSSEKFKQIENVIVKELTLFDLQCVKELVSTLTDENRNNIINKSTHLLEIALFALKVSLTDLPEEWKAEEYVREMSKFLNNERRNAIVVKEFAKMLTV